jgi:hypothetical protein
MDHFDQDMPPDLADIDERLRVNRPIADGPTLDRVMTRAQRVRSRRLSSLLPASRAPRIGRKLAVAMVTLFTVVGSTGVATAVMGVNPVDALRQSSGTSGASGSSRSSEFELQLNAASSQYCPPLQTLEMQRDTLEKQRNKLQKELDDELAKPPNQKDNELIKRLRKEIKDVEKALHDVEKEIKSCYGKS